MQDGYWSLLQERSPPCLALEREQGAHCTIQALVKDRLKCCQLQVFVRGWRQWCSKPCCLYALLRRHPSVSTRARLPAQQGAGTISTRYSGINRTS